jgi:hypothetical protein
MIIITVVDLPLHIIGVGILHLQCTILGITHTTGMKMNIDTVNGIIMIGNRKDEWIEMNVGTYLGIFLGMVEILEWMQGKLGKLEWTPGT